jgi:glycosyltransferase involved in cell wall biosynthesis
MTEALIVNNIPAPYRLPLFEELDDEVDLKVCFLKREKEGRKWSPALSEYSFENEVLPMFNLRVFWIHYTFPLKLIRERPDHIIMGEYFFNFPSILSAILYSKLTGAELTLWSGVLETEYSKSDRGFIKRAYSSFRSLYQKLVYRLADSYIAYCSEAKNNMARRGAEQNKIQVGGQIMPEELLPQTDINKSDTKYNEKNVILSLGYLQERKGIEYLIKAFKDIDMNDTVLVIAGSGPDEERLKELAGGEEDIDFVGYVRGERKAKYYTVADVFVLPTLHDPWGLVVNEALYYDNPVTVTESAGAKDVIKDGENGKVVPPKDPEATAEAVEEILHNIGDYRIEESWTDVKKGIKPFKDILDIKNPN